MLARFECGLLSGLAVARGSEHARCWKRKIETHFSRFPNTLACRSICTRDHGVHGEKWNGDEGQVEIDVICKGRVIKGLRVDLLIGNAVVIELKSVSRLVVDRSADR